MRCDTLRALRPSLTRLVLNSFRIKVKPLRIAKIKDVHKVTNAISITKTENRNLSPFMERANVLDVLFAK